MNRIFSLAALSAEISLGDIVVETGSRGRMQCQSRRYRRRRHDARDRADARDSAPRGRRSQRDRRSRVSVNQPRQRRNRGCRILGDTARRSFRLRLPLRDIRREQYPRQRQEPDGRHRPGGSIRNIIVRHGRRHSRA